MYKFREINKQDILDMEKARDERRKKNFIDSLSDKDLKKLYKIIQKDKKDK